MNLYSKTKWAFTLVLAFLVTGCAFGSGNLQILPSNTSLAVNQSLAFQVTGGTPPYQFQDNGVGAIDNSGNYQAGAIVGQAQIQVSDTTGSTAYATVTVVQSLNTF